MLTKEQKKAHSKELRERWNAAKKLSEQKGHEIDAIIMSHGLDISRTGFMMISMQMKHLGLEGLPYLDAKTYPGWKENGFQVQKGQSSCMSGVTWIKAGGKAGEPAAAAVAVDDKKGFMFPKEYKLFHRSQVAAL